MSDTTKKAVFSNLGLVGGNAKSLKPSAISSNDISSNPMKARQLGAPPAPLQNNRFLNQTALLNNKANGNLNKAATSFDVSPYAHSPYVNNLGFNRDVYSSTPIPSGDVSTKRAAFFDALSELEMAKDKVEKKEPLPPPAAVPAAVPVAAKKPTSRGGPPGAAASIKKEVDNAARRKAPAELPKPATAINPVEAKGFYSPPVSENLDLTKNGPGLTDFDYSKWNAAKSQPVQKNMNPYSVYEFMTYYNKNNSTQINEDQAKSMLQQEASRRNGSAGPVWKDKMNKAEGFEPPPKVIESAGGSTLSQRPDARKLDLVKLLNAKPSAEELDAIDRVRKEPSRDSDALGFGGGAGLLPADISDSNGPLHQGREAGGKTPFQEGLRASKRIEAAELAQKLLSAAPESTDLIFRQLPPERIKEMRDYLLMKADDEKGRAELGAFETINESYLDKLNLNLGYFTPKDKTKSIRVVDFLTDKNSNQTFEEKLKELPPSIISSLKSLPSSDLSRLTYASDVVTGNREAAALANTSVGKEVMPGTRTGPAFGNNVKNLVDTLMNHQTSASDFFETVTSPFTGSWRNKTTYDPRKGMGVVEKGIESRDIEAKIKSLRQLPFSEATKAEIDNLVNKHKSLEGVIGGGVDRPNLAYDAVKPFKDPSRFITNPVTSLADVASVPLMTMFPVMSPAMAAIEGTVGSLKNVGIPGLNPETEEYYGKLLAMLGILAPNPTGFIPKSIPKVPSAIPKEVANIMNNLKPRPMSAGPGNFWNPKVNLGVGKEVPNIAPLTSIQKAMQGASQLASIPAPNIPLKALLAPTVGEITGKGVESFNKGYDEAEAKRNAGSSAPVADTPSAPIASSAGSEATAAPAASASKPNSPATQEGMTGLQKALLAAGIGIPAILALTSAMSGSDDDEDDEDDEESEADYKRRLRARNAYR